MYVCTGFDVRPNSVLKIVRNFLYNLKNFIGMCCPDILHNVRTPDILHDVPTMYVCQILFKEHTNKLIYVYKNIFNTSTSFYELVTL